LAQNASGHVAEIGFHTFGQCQSLEGTLFGPRDNEQIDESYDSGVSQPGKLREHLTGEGGPIKAHN
jgi:hypothetical protein